MASISGIARVAERVGTTNGQLAHPRLALIGGGCAVVAASTANSLTGQDVSPTWVAGASVIAGSAAGGAVLRSSMGSGPRWAALTATLTGVGFGGTIGLGSRALQNSAAMQQKRASR